VLNRVASGEKPSGVLLLENVLSADGAPVFPLYPEDGAIVVPGPLAITRDCPNPVAARAVYDLILSPAGQALITAGDMYAAATEAPPPTGAPPLAELRVTEWPAGFLERTRAEQDQIKARWAEVVSR
jgi:iron(III) transport system substrate-binding protein